MTITILKQSVHTRNLQDQGVPARPLTDPASRLSGIDVALDGAGDNKTGIWECTPGRFERQLAEAEMMHILAGTCTFTPTGGEPLAIRAGDTLFFPAHTTGIWDVQQTLRKVFVVFAPA